MMMMMFILFQGTGLRFASSLLIKTTGTILFIYYISIFAFSFPYDFFSYSSLQLIIIIVIPLSRQIFVGRFFCYIC